jgi:hypothetical protein
LLTAVQEQLLDEVVIVTVPVLPEELKEALVGERV